MGDDETLWAKGVMAWEEGPDIEEYEHRGLQQRAVRHPEWRYWCGYVRIPEDHPWYMRTYQYIEEEDPDLSKHVHGGLTWSGWFPGKEPNVEGWWIGFDCGHASDFNPGLTLRLMEDREMSNLLIPIADLPYRDIIFVRVQIGLLTECVLRRAHLERRARGRNKKGVR